jgi:hypothetical protein
MIDTQKLVMTFSSHPDWLLERLQTVERLPALGVEIPASRSKAIWDRVHMDGVAAIEGGGVVRAVVLGPDPETFEGVAIVFIEGGGREAIVARGKSIQGVHFEAAFYEAVSQYRATFACSVNAEEMIVKPSPGGGAATFSRSFANVGSGSIADYVEPRALGLNESNPVDARILAAIESGIEIASADVAEIRVAFARSEDLKRRGNRASNLGADPMNKGHSFPMGVGFTRMTKRLEQRIDASVRRAGDAAKYFREAQQASAYVEALLAGKGTVADQKRKEAAKIQTRKLLVTKLLNWAKGTTIGGFEVVRVNRDRGNYPASYTIAGPGIVKGFGDKVDVVRIFFGGDKTALRALVDDIRADMSSSHGNCVSVNPELPLAALP